MNGHDAISGALLAYGALAVRKSAILLLAAVVRAVSCTAAAVAYDFRAWIASPRRKADTLNTDWKQEFQRHGAIWLHDGKATRPHALLTSGLHSDGFVNCTFVTQQPALLQKILSAPDGLAPKLPAQHVDWVIGSALGAVTLAYAVAWKLNARAGFTEKDGDAMKLARFEIGPEQKVLVVEDTISTGGSTLKTIDEEDALDTTAWYDEV